MNKKLTTLLMIVALLSVAQTASSCWPGIKGNGNVVKSTRDLSGFDAISVSTGIELYITQDSVEKVIVEADENLQEVIITEVRNGELKIYAEKQIMWSKAKKVYVTAKKIKSLSASAGADVESTPLTTGDIEVSASSGADVELILNAANVKSDASSGANLELKGTGESIRAGVSSGAGIEADGLICKTGEADASSGGHLSIYASQHVNAEASSGGSISVYGNPQTRDSSTSSGGGVHFK